MYRDSLTKVLVKINENSNIIRNNKYAKERYEECNREYVDVITKLDEAKELKVIYNNLMHFTNEAYTEYKNKRNNLLEMSIGNSIDRLFVEEDFTPRITSYPYNGKILTKLELISSDGDGLNLGEEDIRVPKYSEGGFLQQLIGYSSSMTILELLGSKTLLIDEAFSNASDNKRNAMQQILYEHSVVKGIQIIVVSQSDALYKDLPRRQFNLNRNFKTKVTYLESVTDYESTLELDEINKLLVERNGTSES